MCGISGRLLWFDQQDRSIVEEMSASLTHRGPDAGKVEQVGPVVLGHRRLAIIDLSPAGIQPMYDWSGQYCIVFNGEIYNYSQIRQELDSSGAKFQTRTDTEVILEAYKYWGLKCLDKFNGMFAFAIWDKGLRRLFIARDRLGKKPLFYQELADGGVSFASELKALLKDPLVSRGINPFALDHYLSLNYTLTSACIIKNVSKLQAGHYLLVEEGKPFTEVAYWDLASHFRNKREFKSEDEAAEELLALIDDAVRLRLVSDVPLGLFLSGGIDSSTIAASMAKLMPPAEVQSFSMGFNEKGYSELNEASEAARLFGITHRDIVTSTESADILSRIAWHADEPFADTSMIPMYLLAKFCREYVTVCLSGDGGDEIFAGYETYVADRIHHLTQWIPPFFTRYLGEAVDLLWPVKHDKISFDYKLRQFLKGHPLLAPEAHYHWRSIYSEAEKTSLLKPEYRSKSAEHSSLQEFLKYQKDVADCHYLDQAMYVDIKTWLVDDILVKVDRATMAHSLEARAPFLDYRVVEFAASLPVSLKMKGFNKKYILKKSQQGRIPAAILNRKKKGFNAPVSHWITTDWKDRFYHMTLDSQFFNRSYVQTLWMEHENKTHDHGLKLLGLINFQLWFCCQC